MKTGCTSETELKTVYLDTLKGIKLAEKLQSEGWATYHIGFNMVQFYRNEKSKKNYSFDPEILKGLRKMMGSVK